MRNSKTFMAILIVLVLLSIMIAGLSVWGYRIYFATKDQKNKELTVFPKKDQRQQKSHNAQLQVVYNDTFSIKDTSALLRQKLAEINQLQFEIQSILEKRNEPESNSGNESVSLLRDSIDRLKFRNEKIAEENRLLERKINQISRNKEKMATVVERKSTVVAKKRSSSPSVLISSMNFYGIKEDKSTTNSANSTTGFQGAFFVKSNNVQSGELMVVVERPDGKILMNSPWESGVFQSEDGNKVYSAKLHFDSPDQKLNFSIEASDLKKGTYTVEVYYKGKMIATLRKTMS